MPKTELQKMDAIETEFGAVSEFLEWCNNQGYYICQHSKGGSNGQKRFLHPDGSECHHGLLCMIEGTKLNPEYAYEEPGYYPVRGRSEAIINQYFEIDPKKLEQERRELLRSVQAMNKGEQR